MWSTENPSDYLLRQELRRLSAACRQTADAAFERRHLSSKTPWWGHDAGVDVPNVCRLTERPAMFGVSKT